MKPHGKSDSPLLLFALEETGAFDYRSSNDREFLERLHFQSQRGKWFGDGWARDDRTIVTVTITNGSKVVYKTLRIDFFGDRVVVGYDTTHQLVEDLDINDSRTIEWTHLPVQEMADLAAEWVQTQLELEPWLRRTNG